MRRIAMIAAACALAACASTTPTRPGPSTAGPAAEETFRLQPTDFSNLPDWQSADLAPALLALRRTCDARRSRGQDANWSTVGIYGGTMRDWAPACAAAFAVAPGGERQFFEQYFTPHLVRGPGEARLTAYYEPMIQARRTSAPGFTEPLVRAPTDIVAVDVAAFAEAYDDATLRGAPRRLTGQLRDGVVRPYPKRSELAPRTDQVIAWAHPVDVYNLQVQGSGRLQFEDGTYARAAYASQNGYRWNSALGALRNSGEMPNGATWPNFRAWSDERGVDATRAALNADPSYVFFQLEGIDDPSAGPRGAAGIPLTPMGSIAVDPAFHPYGAIVFVDGTFDGAPFRRLMVTQDTGGAIRRGPQRGDVFMGSGPEAGDRAQRMNAPARWWTLLPRGVPVA